MSGSAQVLEQEMIADPAGHPSRSRLEVLTSTWWIVCPVFAVLSLRLVAERACADPYELLPAVTANPRWAWPLALVYVAGHLWCLFAYLFTTEVAGTLAPGLAAIKSAWGRNASQVWLMAGVLALEYAPMSILRLAGAHLGCHW
jgi:hypothetical protein